jgi:hypothetical protein
MHMRVVPIYSWGLRKRNIDGVCEIFPRVNDGLRYVITVACRRGVKAVEVDIEGQRGDDRAIAVAGDIAHVHRRELPRDISGQIEDRQKQSITWFHSERWALSASENVNETIPQAAVVYHFRSVFHYNLAESFDGKVVLGGSDERSRWWARTAAIRSTAIGELHNEQ